MQGNIGRFHVAREFLDLENIPTRRLMERVVVLEAEYDFMRNRFTYTALCDDFEEIDQGAIPPEYTVIVSGDPVGISFVRTPSL